MWLLLCFLIHKCFSKKKEIQLGIRTEKFDSQSDLIQQKDPTCLTLDAVVQEWESDRLDKSKSWSEIPWQLNNLLLHDRLKHRTVKSVDIADDQ